MQFLFVTLTTEGVESTPNDTLASNLGEQVDFYIAVTATKVHVQYVATVFIEPTHIYKYM